MGVLMHYQVVGVGLRCCCQRRVLLTWTLETGPSCVKRWQCYRRHSDLKGTELVCRALAAHKGLDSRDLFGEFSAGDLRVMSSLGTQPVARAQSQETAKA